IVVSSNNNWQWIWHGRITDIKKNMRIWDVAAVSEFDFRVAGTALKQQVEVVHEYYTENGRTHTKSDSGTILKEIVKKALMANPEGLPPGHTVYTLIPSETDPELSFDRFNGCGLHIPYAHFLTAYPPCIPGAAVQYKSISSLIDHLLTKRKYRMFVTSNYTTITDYGMAPYNIPILSRILHQTMDIVFGFDYKNLMLPIRWQSFSPSLINKVTIEYTGHRNALTVAPPVANLNDYWEIGNDAADKHYFIFQTLTSGTETLGSVLQSYNIYPEEDNTYKIYGIKFSDFGIYSIPHYPLRIALYYVYGGQGTEITFRNTVCGQISEGEEYPLDGTRVLSDVVMPEQSGNCVTIPADATTVWLKMHMDAGFNVRLDDGGRWYIFYYRSSQDIYPHGEAYYRDNSNIDHHAPENEYWDLPITLYIGSERRVFNLANENSIKRYGVKSVYLRNPLNITESNIANFADRLLKYSEKIANEGEVIANAIITPVRIAPLPGIASNLCFGIKVYDKVNKIGTETNPAIFMLEKSEFVFPQCVFNLHLAKIPHGEEYLLFDKIRNVQDDLVQNL
ncbi:MAG: hypothetical protein QW531_04650, partial [Thermoplasmata archaeon]